MLKKIINLIIRQKIEIFIVFAFVLLMFSVGLLGFKILNSANRVSISEQDSRTQEARVYRNKHIEQTNHIAHELLGHEEFGINYRQFSVHHANAQIYDRKTGTIIYLECWRDSCNVLRNQTR